MANANFIELETCIEQCIKFCAEHPNLEFIETHSLRLDAANRKFYDALEESDEKFIAWQQSTIQEKLKWKKVAQIFATTQRELKRINATDYPNEVVRHWDVEILEHHVALMLKFLSSKIGSIDEAKGWHDTLERSVLGAKSESENNEQRLGDYRRFARLRAEGLGTLNSVLGDFRDSMRRHLGKKSDLYQSIRWPMSLSPDETVL